MIAIKGNWFCDKCKREMDILYVDTEEIDAIQGHEKYCGKCLQTTNTKRLKDIELYNENRELI